MTTTVDAPWRTRAACRVRWAEFTSDFRGEPGYRYAARMIHVCRRHCSVLAQCTDATKKHRPIEMVQAGLLWPWARRPKELPDPGCGPWCQTHRGIQRIGGMPQ